jgi:hypothetical protein
MSLARFGAVLGPMQSSRTDSQGSHIQPVMPVVAYMQAYSDELFCYRNILHAATL